MYHMNRTFLVAQMVKNVPSTGDLGSIPESEKSAGVEWHSTLVFLPGEFHGHRFLAGYNL